MNMRKCIMNTHCAWMKGNRGRVAAGVLCLSLAALATVPPTAQAQMTADGGAGREAAWNAAYKRLIQAEAESRQACDARIAACSAFFTARQRGAGRFAGEVLGLEGKLRATGGMIENGVNAVGQYFGYGPGGKDSFTRHVESRFRELVISPDQVRQVTREALAGYQDDMRRIEGRVLVDLRADLSDNALAFASPDAGMLLGNDDFIVRQVASDAAGDLGVSLVKLIISSVLSDAVTDKVMDKNDSFLKRQGTNFAIGMAMDKALDQAALAGGYDPQKRIEVRVKATLDRLAAEIVEGRKVSSDAFVIMSRWSNLHPDGRVRDAAAKAVAVMERSPGIGLRARLLSLHWSRVRSRSLALSRHILGPGVPLRLTHSLKLGDTTPETLIDLANQCSRDFGGK
jgi:hypothetical protein